MKFALTVGSLDALKKYIKTTDIDIFIIGNQKYANRLVGSFDVESLKEAVSYIKKNNKEVYINTNLIAHAEDLMDLRSYLIEINKMDIDGILFSDTAIYNYAKELNVLSKLIYNPETLNTNIYDPVFWNKKGIKGLTISNEIPKDELYAICDNSEILTTYYGHGYLNMFHSRRPLIENFLKYNQKEYKQYVDNRNLHLIEEIRNESYPVFQDNKGTHIFRDKIMMSYNEIKEMTEHLDVFIIDSILCGEEYIIDTVSNYKRIMNDEIDSNELSNSLLNTHDSGFLYKKTVYDKY